MSAIAFKCKEFSITQENSALKLGTDAFILGAFTSAVSPCNILDIGTGCGILALMLAQKYPTAKIDAIDIDEGAVKDAQENFRTSKWNNNLNALKISIQDYASLCKKKYDIIISNPPFFSDSILSTNESKNNARHTITLNAKELIKNSSSLLNKKGKLAIIIPYSNKDEYIGNALNNELFLIEELKILPFQTKVANRVILVFSKTSNNIKQQELIIRKDNKEYTSDYIQLTKDFYL